MITQFLLLLGVVLVIVVYAAIFGIMSSHLRTDNETD